jgi:PAS domain S-box-containing protein
MNKTNFWNVLQKTFPFKIEEFFLILAFLISLYLTSLVSYNLFHIIIELICIIIAFGIFIVAWNAKNFFSNHYLLFISIGFLFVSIIDITHTIVYKGLEVFVFIDPTSNLATQLWIAAGYLQALFMIIAPVFLTRKMNIGLVFKIFFLVVLFIFVSVFYYNIFPIMYVEGLGPTLINKVSEYLILLIFVGSAVFLVIKRKYLNENVFKYILTSIIFTIASELAFSTYLSSYHFSNLIGSFLKIISFSLIYKVIVETGVKNPLSYIFRNLEQSNEKIKNSELKFRTLVDIAPSAVILTNNKGEISLWNQSAEVKFGWKSKEVLGRSLNIICPTENIKGNKNNIKQLIDDRDAGNLNKSVETIGLRKNGEIFSLEISSSSYKINNEDFFCYIVRDISEKVKYEKELVNKKKKLENLVNDLKIYKLAMDNAFVHIVITDRNGIIVYANNSTSEITGFNIKEIIGKTPSLWGRQMPDSFYENFWRIIKIEKKSYAGEITNKRKNGEIYQAEIRVSPVLDMKGEVEFFVAIERDITEAKAMERAKTEFISLAAHQLKTPLTSISLTSELLLRGINGEMSEDNKKYLRNIFMEVKDMTKLIEIFLNVSRIEMGKFPIETERISLSDILDKTIQKTLPHLKSKKLALEKNYKNNLPVLNLDKKVMNIILENLISNAIKYSTKNGIITLSAEHTIDSVIIKVSDDGIGIPEHEQSKIFTKMFRAGNVTDIKSEGSGLGLYLVKNLAEQCGFNISFVSKVKEGATFSLTIPLSNSIVERKLVDISKM